MQSTIVVFNIVQDLLSLMKKLPLYCNNFLEMINRILTEYYEACYTSYKGLYFFLLLLQQLWYYIQQRFQSFIIQSMCKSQVAWKLRFNKKLMSIHLFYWTDGIHIDHVKIIKFRTVPKCQNVKIHVRELIDLHRNNHFSFLFHQQGWCSVKPTAKCRRWSAPIGFVTKTSRDCSCLCRTGWTWAVAKLKR